MNKENELPQIQENSSRQKRLNNPGQYDSQLLKEGSMYGYEPPIRSNLTKRHRGMHNKGIGSIKEKIHKVKTPYNKAGYVVEKLAKSSSVNLNGNRTKRALTKHYTSIDSKLNRNLATKKKLESNNAENVQNNKAKTTKKLPVLKPEVSKPQTYTFVITKGNNSKLVRRILSTRQNFVDYEELSNLEKAKLERERQFVNLFWDPVKKINRIEKLCTTFTSKPRFSVMYNHFEHNTEIASKYFLYKNLRAKYGDEANTFLPPTFIFDFYNKNLLNNLASYLVVLFTAQHPEYLNGRKTEQQGIVTSNEDEDENGFANEIQRFTTLIDDLQDFLNNNLFKHTSRRNIEVDLNKIFLLKLEEARIADYYSCFVDGNNMWLLKPDFCNRGTGVEIYKSPEDFIEKLKGYVKGFEKDKHNKEEDKLTDAPVRTIKPKKFVVQKYIEKPMLINDRKFDIRIYGLIDHEANIYTSKEGYIRTSSEKFSLDTDLRLVHLTNNAVQKYNQNYCKFEEGNILPLRQIEVSL